MTSKILVTLDGSETAEQALPTAVEQARCTGADIHLLRVIRPLAESYQAGLAAASTIVQAEKELQEIAQEYLDKIISKLHLEGLQVSSSIRVGLPHEEIVDYAKENEIDLVVMCTCGEGGFRRRVLGNTIDHVIRGNQIPVLAVPAK